MPVTPTYPGVYIEEIPSGVRTITGVATSITAFIGRALRGPVDEAVTINNYGDFERKFGGLWVESTLGYAVRDFYLNGGGQAIIVRLYHAEEGVDAKPAKAKLAVDGLTFEAAYEGAWGNHLRARVDHDVAAATAERYGLEVTDLFNLAVHDAKSGATELFRNVSVVASPRQVDKVLENGSSLVRVVSPLPAARPAEHPDPQPGEDVWGDNPIETNSKVADADQSSDGARLEECARARRMRDT